MNPNRPTLHLREGDDVSAALGILNDAEIDGLLQFGVLMSDGNGRLRLNFVGVAVAGHVTLVALPKVLLASAPKDVAAVTVGALREYARRQPARDEPSPHLNADTAKGPVSGIALADWLVRDFQANGLYRRDAVTSGINDGGRTDWRDTISRRHPIHSRGGPIYWQRTTRRSSVDPTNFATALHLHLIESLSLEFGPLLGVSPIRLDHELVTPLGQLPLANECRSKITAEMRETYTDRSLRLLPTLLAIVQAREVETERRLALFGTSSFHTVWEAACGYVCGNQVESWKSALPAPRWISTDGTTRNAETFRPDIVVPVSDEPRTLLIADAKYYRPSLPPDLHSVPGVNDVAKQVWYRTHLTLPAHEKGFSHMENVFLFPGGEGPLLRHAGAVEFPDRDARVEAIKLDFLQALRAYTDRDADAGQRFKKDFAKMALGTEQVREPPSSKQLLPAT